MSWNDCLSNPSDPNSAPTLGCATVVFSNIVDAALIFAGVVALFFIVISGIKFITSGGDPKQVEGARKTLTWAIIGLVVVFLSFFIVKLISYLTGAHCIEVFGFGQCK